MDRRYPLALLWQPPESLWERFGWNAAKIAIEFERQGGLGAVLRSGPSELDRFETEARSPGPVCGEPDIDLAALIGSSRVDPFVTSPIDSLCELSATIDVLPYELRRTAGWIVNASSEAAKGLGITLRIGGAPSVAPVPAPEPLATALRSWQGVDKAVTLPASRFESLGGLLHALSAGKALTREELSTVLGDATASPRALELLRDWIKRTPTLAEVADIVADASPALHDALFEAMSSREDDWEQVQNLGGTLLSRVQAYIIEHARRHPRPWAKSFAHRLSPLFCTELSASNQEALVDELLSAVDPERKAWVGQLVAAGLDSNLSYDLQVRLADLLGQTTDPSDLWLYRLLTTGISGPKEPMSTLDTDTVSRAIDAARTRATDRVIGLRGSSVLLSSPQTLQRIFGVGPWVAEPSHLESLCAVIEPGHREGLLLRTWASSARWKESDLSVALRKAGSRLARVESLTITGLASGKDWSPRRAEDLILWNLPRVATEPVPVRDVAPLVAWADVEGQRASRLTWLLPRIEPSARVELLRQVSDRGIECLALSGDGTIRGALEALYLETLYKDKGDRRLMIETCWYLATGGTWQRMDVAKV